MSIASHWYIFGPAAVCWAAGRPLPPVVDVYITTYRPDRKLLTTLLKADDLPTARYTTEEPAQIVNLDNVRLQADGSGLAISDPDGVLKTRAILVRNHQLSLMQSLRLRYEASLFSDFDWPSYLVRKLDSDLAYAKLAADRDEAMHLCLLNLDHDFGLTLGAGL